MVSAGWSVTGRESLLGVVARSAGRWLRRSGRRAGDVLQLMLRIALTLGGLGLAVASAYVGLGLWAGLLAGSISLLVLEWVVKRPGARQ